MAWQDRAACKGMTDLFYGKTAPYRKRAAICAGCPVLAECRDAGLYERDGFWGGMSQRERRRERQRLGITLPPDRPAAECGTTGGRQRHRLNGETPCAACKLAHAADMLQRRNAA